MPRTSMGSASILLAPAGMLPAGDYEMPMIGRPEKLHAAQGSRQNATNRGQNARAPQAILDPLGCISILAAEEFHDIAPPVDYSLIPPWMIFVGAFIGLTLLGLLGWWIAQKRKHPQPPQLPRQRAIEALERIADEIERMTAYQFSIRVSDILRRYVTEQYALPLTRQTSVEFLNALRNSASFSEEEKSLLADFLNRCDLIKFARYEATTADSQLLLEEAMRFVKGGELAIV